MASTETTEALEKRIGSLRGELAETEHRLAVARNE